MKVDTAILIPTLGRAHRIPEIVENVGDTAPNARVHFIAEETDEETVEALKGMRATIGDFGTYGKAINAGYKDCPERWLMTSDDDCIYHKDWLKLARQKMKGAIRIVGTNDLHNPYVLDEEHSTHSLVDRRYLDDIGAVIDQGPGSFMFEYDHNYTDAELIETAKARGVFAPCLESIVEHVHPEFGGREPDDTWRKTRRAVSEDHAIFCQRRKLWEHNEDLEYRPIENQEA